jgi:sortase B
MEKNPKKKLRRILTVSSIFLFLGCGFFLLYYLVLQPYHSRKVNEKYRTLYYSYESVEETTEKKSKSKKKAEPIDINPDQDYKNNAKDENGVLLKFKKLIGYNEDIRGWLKIPGTKIDYPVMQDYHGGDYYLEHDFEGHKDKNGCLYLDGHSSIEIPSTNLVIHGHNMDSTHMMFYELPNYKNLEFYQKHPVITFDTLYQNSKWKIISFMRVSGTMEKNKNFNYLTGIFYDKEDFRNFLYEIESRSLYHCPVDVNEKDHLLMLSTCSYEFDNCRTVVVARRLRKGEDENVETSQAYLRNNVLYPDEWYRQYGGKAPVHTTFADALAFNEIDWYDGKKKGESPIGQQYTVENHLLFELTSLDTVKYIGSNDNTLSKLVIPDKIEVNGRVFNVTEIASDTFSSMTKLDTVYMKGGIAVLPENLFRKCKKLTTVALGAGIKEIGAKAFYNIPHLRKLTISSKELTQIGEQAFWKTDSKIKIYLPKSKEKAYKKLLEAASVPKTATYKQKN